MSSSSLTPIICTPSFIFASAVSKSSCFSSGKRLYSANQFTGTASVPEREPVVVPDAKRVDVVACLYHSETESVVVAVVLVQADEQNPSALKVGCVEYEEELGVLISSSGSAVFVVLDHCLRSLSVENLDRDFVDVFVIVATEGLEHGIPVQENPTQPDHPPPLGEGFPIRDSGIRVSGNFPREFVLLDGKRSVRDILYLMRQEAFQGLCDQVPGIPGDLLAHTRQVYDGCHFVTRISQGKELFMLVSHAGQNCYDATERMIEEPMTDKGEPIYTESWVNGAGFEFYGVGIRDFNTPEIDPEPSNHLGHVHVVCTRYSEIIADRYELYINNWDDGMSGKSIIDAVATCHLSPTEWRYEDAPGGGSGSIVFKDGTTPEKWAKWRMIISNGGCAESKIVEAIGFRAGGLDCPFDEWFELDPFS
ncbi:hypothetical protein EDB81DRAFT_882449 [Dactylonectria macrodidyma]|uniref:Uncharacterized protein n=1 Tax=Dactylonectria macrodidyma TaxID=307937 RepID=A0A9P9F6F0_9HYPO|nr:hypothetical protein EDB81DRAFT_882449 [Dactylonectria macrodidyma]